MIFYIYILQLWIFLVKNITFHLFLLSHVKCFDWILDVCHVGSFPRVCYERCPINPTAATFLLSAMWHGVYPGYYLTFLTGIAMTMAARAVSTQTVSVYTYSCLSSSQPRYLEMYNCKFSHIYVGLSIYSGVVHSCCIAIMIEWVHPIVVPGNFASKFDWFASPSSCQSLGAL